MLQNISLFLQKFKNITPPTRFIKESCIKTVSDIAGITLSENDIHIRGEAIFIYTDSVKKNEIFLHKQKILDALLEKLRPCKKTIKNIL